MFPFSGRRAESFLILASTIVAVSSTSFQTYGYGTKTSYKSAGNLQSLQTPQGCTPVQLNMLLRHGARFPSDGSKERAKTLLKKLNKVHSKGFKYKNVTLPWNLPFIYGIAEGSELSPTGELMMYELGKRFRDRFPTLFTNPYWNRLYEFTSTSKQRTVRSAAAFSYGIFEGKGNLGNSLYQPIPIKFSGPKDDDRILRYYDACPKYQKEIEEGNGLHEWRKFGVSPAMKQLIATIQERLQIRGKLNLTAEDVLELFMLCAFSTQFSENKGWCSLFTDDDLEVLNYWIDMKNYYGHSYGNKLAYEASCPLMADITNSLKKFVNASMPIGIFRFAHSGTVFALETILEQFYHGVIYDSDMYHKDQYRPFRSYDMVPMGANVAFVLYKCSGSEEYKVQVLVNEKLMELPCCKRNGQTTCSLDIFSLCFGQSCNFDEMCRVSSASLRHVPTLWLVIVIVVLNIHFCFGRMTSELF